MTEPTVCAVMLTKDRGEMARQAVASFRAQTYDPASRMLLIFDTGDLTWYDPRSDAENEHQIGFTNRNLDWTIGQLRNEANSLASRFDVIVHWDSDDWSHPTRIAEQVELLQSSGAAAVGYNKMLFWRERVESKVGEIDPGEAWLYTGSILGTSLCYWRKTWERVPFRSQRANPTHDKGVGEDHDFLLDLHAAGMKSVGVSGFGHDEPTVKLSCQGTDFGPRMIARIHGSNTSNAYNPADMARETQHWKRVPEWDQFCRRTME